MRAELVPPQAEGVLGRWECHPRAARAALALGGYDAVASRLHGYAWSENTGWINLDLAVAEQFVAFLCRADFNGDGIVNTQDFFDYLTAFLAGSVGAEFNHDGVVNTQDLFDFIAAFFAGC